MTCPACGAFLNALTGQDGHAVEVTVDSQTKRRQVERRLVATVYTCPKCEHCQVGTEGGQR